MRAIYEPGANLILVEDKKLSRCKIACGLEEKAKHAYSSYLELVPM